VTVSVLGSLVGVLGLVFIARVLSREWDEVTRIVSTTEPGLIVAGVLVGTFGMTWIGLQWVNVLSAIGADSPRSQVLRSYFIGQLGKYVPGGVWPVLGRAEMLVRSGVARSAAYPSVGLSMVTTYLAAVILSSIAAPFALWGTDGHQAYVLIALPIGLALLHPALLGRVLSIAERLFSKDEPTIVPKWRAAIALVLRHVPAWAFISLATWMVARSMHVDAGLAPIAFATPLAWAAGLAALPVPGGIGVREAVFVALMTSDIDASSAATVAITARLIFIVVDLLAAAAVSVSPTTRRSATT
jgi:uncharacterized membrane protein YbhN (UPF0104 family)